VTGEQNRLRMDLSEWRQDQLLHMKSVTDHAANQVTQEPEEQILYLPSDFPNSEVRRDLGLDQLEVIEMKLREGEAYDALRDLRTAVKHVNGLTYKKQTNVRHAGPNTRAKEMIDDVKRKRDGYIDRYNGAREAMISLGCTCVGDQDEFPRLTVADAVMKYTERPHACGDGSRSMAKIWRIGGQKKLLLHKESWSTNKSVSL
jgi:hypothetical protein